MTPRWSSSKGCTEKPRSNYYVGHSQGGREGLMVSQRYPADYDGILSLAPIVDFSSLMLAPVWIRIHERQLANWVTPAKIKAIRGEPIRQCDKLDGLADGIINNYMACWAIFDVRQGAPDRDPWAAKRCPNNIDPDPADTSSNACLTDGQITTLDFVYSRYQFATQLANGRSSFGMWLRNIDSTEGELNLATRYNIRRGPEGVYCPGSENGNTDWKGVNMFKFLRQRVRVGRPVVIAPPTGDVQLPGTTIYVRSAVILQTGGNYAATVLQHLQEIQAFQIGAQFFLGLTALGKRQVIRYGGPNNNQAAGGGLSSYCMLRRYHDSDENANFSVELQATITRSGHTKGWLAEQLYQTRLPRWSGATSPSPFWNIRQPPPPRVAPGGRRPLPSTPPQLIEQQIDRWIAGNGLPTRDELDVLLLVLENWLVNGTGTNTLISYDPHKVQVGGAPRPPHAALFHELVHAYYNASGSQLGREDSISEDNGGRLFELMAVGLPPFQGRPYGENQFRAAIGTGPRLQYP